MGRAFPLHFTVKLGTREYLSKALGHDHTAELREPCRGKELDCRMGKTNDQVYSGFRGL